jgi:hypothetical protein
MSQSRLCRHRRRASSDRPLHTSRHPPRLPAPEATSKGASEKEKGPLDPLDSSALRRREPAAGVALAARHDSGWKTTERGRLCSGMSLAFFGETDPEASGDGVF